MASSADSPAYSVMSNLLARSPPVPSVLHLQPREGHVALREVGQVQHHLEDGRVRKGALRMDLLQDALERQVLVRVRLQRRLAHAAQQLAEGRVARQVRAQGQRVQEEADQAFRFAPRAPGDGRADHHVVLPRQAAQDDVHGGQEHHEERGALAARKPKHRIRFRALQRDRLRGARVRLHGGARTVRGQLQQGRGTGQLAPPVAQLRVQHVAR